MMKRVAFVVLAGALFFLQPTTSEAALQCRDVSAHLSVTARAKATESSSIIHCTVENVSALHFDGKLSSSLYKARGYIAIRFFDLQGKSLGTLRSGPWLGPFSGLILDDSIAVPAHTALIQIAAQTESTRDDAAGEWNVADFKISSGVAIVEEMEKDFVISTDEAAQWRFATAPADAQGEFNVELRSLSGELIKSQKITKAEKQTTVNFGKLSVGYYNVYVRFGSEHSAWKSVLVVLPNYTPPNEKRFGIDGFQGREAITMFTHFPSVLTRTLHMMRKAGIGSVRDRFAWRYVQPTRENQNWKDFENAANTIAAAGLDLVIVFNDSPSWSLAGSSAPLVETEVFKFGQLYAQRLGKVIRSVEFWNEPNFVTFFAGYPFQYASGLKAFSTGVKSVDPEINVLIGSSANSPGRFFEEIYRNNVSNYFDTRNQHYYGNGELDDFFDKSLAVLERNAGIAGKPGWMTESGYALRPDKSGSWLADELKQAEQLVKIFVGSFSVGYERVFYYNWKEFIESETHAWGIVHEDLSPRPAYLALALLTRHLAGASIVAAERHGTGRTVFFQKEDKSIVAVTWGGGAAIGRLGHSVEISSIFGQKLENIAPEASGTYPLLLSKIGSLPARAQPVVLPRQTRPELPRLRLEAQLRISGKDHAFPGGNRRMTEANAFHPGNRVAVSVREGENIEILTRIHSSSPERGETVLTCVPESGLELLSPERQVFYGSVLDGEVFACRLRARLASMGEKRVVIRATKNKYSDVVQVVFVPDVTSAESGLVARPLMPGNTCPHWVPRYSANITPAVALTRRPSAPCPAASIVSRIDRQGSSWISAVVQIPAGELAGSAGLRVQITPVPGRAFAPKPFLLQLVEKSGTIWLLNLRQGESGNMYSGLYSLATVAPWGRATVNVRPDLGNMREFLIGWGGYDGKVGEQHGFTIDAMDVLQ